MVIQASGIRFWLGLIAVLLCQSLFSQALIKGVAVDRERNPVPYLNVMIRPIGSNVVLAFGITNSDGGFSIIVKNEADSLNIAISSIHYRNQNRHIKNMSQEMRFEMETDIKQLETFTVRASPIQRKGDTLSYLVQSFSGEADRSIEDVLRRMPGIEIESDGRIIYQGMPIQKFYVEGLDLMDGRYTAISSNLPHKSVSVVEVLENHQPVRILEDRISSQQASLNLRLKNNITTTGTAKFGLGYAEHLLWDANITPMAFTKEFQLLGSYQTNNSGTDVSQQLKSLGFEDMLDHDKPLSEISPLIIQSPIVPHLNQDRFLLNNIHLINLNGLLRLKRDLQVRANLHFVNDFQKQKAEMVRHVFMPEDTLIFNENMDNRNHDSFLKADLTLSRNVKTNYLNNKLSIESGWSSSRGNLYDGNKQINQTLNKPVRSISNDLRSTYPIGGKLVEFISYISFDQNNHTLIVKPGVFENTLNNSLYYDKTRQHLDLKRFYAHHTAGFIGNWKGLTINPRAGFVFRKQGLESTIVIVEGDTENPAGSSFDNQLHYTLFRSYVQTGIEYKRKGMTIKALLPLSYVRLEAEDPLKQISDGLNKLLFDPSLSLIYKFKSFWQFSSTYFQANRLGEMDDVHYGFILKKYNTLFQNATPLEFSNSRNISVRISYRNPILSFFNSLTYISGIKEQSVVYSNSLLSNGSSIAFAANIPNTSHFQNLQINSSKYFSITKSTVSLKAIYSLNKRLSLLNDALFEVENRIFNLGPQLNTRFSSWLNAEYRLEMNYITTKLDQIGKQRTTFSKHHLNVFAFPRDNLMLSFTNELYLIGKERSLFSDINFRRSLKPKGLDLEIKWSNIFNAKTYTVIQANAYTLFESRFYLRPAQLLVSVKFNF